MHKKPSLCEASEGRKIDHFYLSYQEILQKDLGSTRLLKHTYISTSFLINLWTLHSSLRSTCIWGERIYFNSMCGSWWIVERIGLDWCQQKGHFRKTHISYICYLSYGKFLYSGKLLNFWILENYSQISRHGINFLKLRNNNSYVERLSCSWSYYTTFWKI